ncbi:hypothetical protein PG291_01785 [Riemerella anatipestifer]|nr:hypothetical protein [Riemerella anatipestifer]
MDKKEFGFIYRYHPKQEYCCEFHTEKETLIEAIKEFMAHIRGKKVWDIDPEVSVGDDFIEINPTQDRDGSWDFIVDGEMILEEL